MRLLSFATPRRVLFASALLLELLFIAMHTPPGRGYASYLHIALAASAVWLCAAWALGKFSAGAARSDRRLALFLVAAGMVMRVTLLPLGPIGSDDIYRYLWDGKVLATGHDPYRVPPDDPSLADLHSATLPAWVTFPQMRTIYPPLAQCCFALAYLISAESVIAFKLLLLACELATMLLMMRALMRWNRAPHLVGIYALAPLPMMQFLIDGHLDALGFPALMLAVLWWKGSPARARSALALGAAAAVKLVPFIHVPVMYADALRDAHAREAAGRGMQVRALLRPRLLVAAAPVALLPVLVVALTYAPSLAIGSSPFDMLATYSQRWVFNGSIYPILAALIPHRAAARFAALALFAAGLAVIAWRRDDAPARMLDVTMLFFACATTVHPWYITWIAVLLPFRLRWSAAALTATINLSFAVVVTFRATGMWLQPAWLAPVEYLPVLCILIAESLRTRRARLAPHTHVTEE